MPRMRTTALSGAFSPSRKDRSRSTKGAELELELPVIEPELEPELVELEVELEAVPIAPE